MSIQNTVLEVKRAEQMLANEIDVAYPIGARFRISWMHESTPEVEVVRSMSQFGALRCRFVKDVPNRVASKPPIRKAGDEETVVIGWIIS